MLNFQKNEYIRVLVGSCQSCASTNDIMDKGILIAVFIFLMVAEMWFTYLVSIAAALICIFLLSIQVEEIRREIPNVVYLSGGDYYQGTIWYTIYKWKVVSHFVNKLNHTAMVSNEREFLDAWNDTILSWSIWTGMFVFTKDTKCIFMRPCRLTLRMRA